MIRRADKNDALQIYNLEMLSFSNPYSLTTIQYDLSSDKVAVFVYIKNDVIVGYISIYYFMGEANLQKVVVAESERRQGIATCLIEYAIDFLKNQNIEKFYLEVNEHNVIAISVYEKLGFERISTRKNYYGSESAIIYEKKFRSSLV